MLLTNIFEENNCNGRVALVSAPMMTSKMKGFVAKARAVNPEIGIRHCLTHREAAIAKVLPVFRRLCWMTITSQCLSSRLFRSFVPGAGLWTHLSPTSRESTMVIT